LFVQRIGFQVAAAIVGMAISVLTARWLGPEGKGVLSLVLLVPFVGASIAGFGLNEAISFLSHRRGIPLSRFVAALPLQIVLIGLPAAFLAAAFLFTRGLGMLEYRFDFMLAGLAAALLVVRMAVLVLRGVIRADERFETVLLIDAVEIVSPLIVLLAFQLMVGTDVVTAATAFLMGTIAALILCIANSGRYREPVAGIRVWREQFAAVWSYGAATQMRFTGVMLIQRANFLVVGAMLGMDELGLYVVAVAVAEVLVKIPDAASWIVTPRAARETDERAHSLTLRYARWVLMLTALGAIVIGLVAKPAMLLLFDTDFVGASSALVAMLAGVTVLSYSRVLESSLVGRGRAASVALATWIGGAVMLAFDLILVPRYGIAGAGSAASVGYIVTSALVIASYAKERGRLVDGS